MIVPAERATKRDLAGWRRLLVGHELAAVADADAELANSGRLARQVGQRLGARTLESLDGVIERADGSVEAALLWGDGHHPLGDSLERHLVEVACAPDRAAAASTLLDEAVRRARADGVDLLRVRLPARGLGQVLAPQLVARGFFRHYHAVRRVTGAELPECNGWEWHRTRREERAFVYDCLAAATANGHVGPPADGALAARMRALVLSRYRLLHARNRISVVASLEGRPVSHALVELGPARYGRGCDAFLVDVFVARDQGGGGWARRLGAVALELAKRAGAARVDSIVSLVGTPDPETLLANLGRAGWWIDRDCWVLPLSRRERRAWRERAARTELV
jgi:hypothetical protein